MLITFEPICHRVVKKSMNFVIKIEMSEMMKKVVVIIFLSVFSLNLFAPATNALVIEPAPYLNPFGKLIYAIGMVETKLDTLAYNPKEEAVGYFQIRPIRLLDYNNRTGSNYRMRDLYDYHISEKIFLYYASQIGPYNNEKIAKNWNGSGIRTKAYWKEVRKHL
jgi:hypothetical protein